MWVLVTALQRTLRTAMATMGSSPITVVCSVGSERLYKMAFEKAPTSPKVTGSQLPLRPISLLASTNIETILPGRSRRVMQGPVCHFGKGNRSIVSRQQLFFIFLNSTRSETEYWLQISVLMGIIPYVISRSFSVIRYIYITNLIQVVIGKTHYIIKQSFFVSKSITNLQREGTILCVVAAPPSTFQPLYCIFSQPETFF